MCVYQFKIGSQVMQDFMDMTPSPPGPTHHVTFLQRTNVDGSSIFYDGLRGEIFELHTLSDEDDGGSALSRIRGYEGMTGKVFNVQWNDQPYGLYLLENVKCNAREVLKIIGGKNGYADPKYLIESTWLLYPTTPA
jgi:hypothetical protein